MAADTKQVTMTEYNMFPETFIIFQRPMITVFLSRFGAFLTSLLTFAQHLVQPPQHLVICAHHSSSFSFLPTNCKCFWTCINCFHTTLCCFITLSFAYVMSVKINWTCECWIVIPYKTNSPHCITWVITYKNVELVVKICQANFIKMCKSFFFTWEGSNWRPSE